MEIVHSYGPVKYIEAEGVYPVMEDSLLLVKAVLPLLKNMKGKLLDMGCGTGLISLLASYHGWEVYSVDKEPLALLNLRRNMDLNGLDCQYYLSDLCGGLPISLLNSFDLVTFNPPYLPDLGAYSDRRSDLPLVGGKGGWETTERFLALSKDLLTHDGRIILLVYSSWMERLFLEGFKIGIEQEKGHDLQGEHFSILHLKRSKWAHQ